MLVPVSVVSLLLPTLALGSQVYLGPPSDSSPSRWSSSSSSSSNSPAVSLSAPQANAVFAHHLGVSSYVDLPLSSQRQGARAWEDALVDTPASDSHLVIVLECPNHAPCTDAVPDSVRESSKPYTLPTLSPTSYLAALSLHLHRLADSLHLDPNESTAVQGLTRVVQHGLKSVAGWQGSVGKELASWIGYDSFDPRRQPDQPAPPVRTLSEFDFLALDPAGHQLASELQHVVSVADSFADSQNLPNIAIVHLKGLKDLAAKHAPASIEYQRAAGVVRATLSALVASYDAQSRRLAQSSSTLVLALDPPKQPLLRKRQPWLDPFSTSVSRYTSRTKRHATPHDRQKNMKRSVFVAAANDDDSKKSKNSTVIVPTSSKCFASLEELNNQTASCLSHGVGVRGISTRGDAKECWVCKCGSTFDDETGKKTYWAGQGCEKVDLSGSFSLLFFSSLGLILILAASVTLLYKVGSVELPGTLSAVGGTGGGHIKRD